VLVKPYDEWRIAGDVAQTYLSSLQPCLESAPAGMPILVTGAPDSLDASTADRAMLHPGILGPYSVAPAIALVMPEFGQRQVLAGPLVVLAQTPREVATRCGSENGTWLIRTDFAT
jgi:hypothetical protein